ncbi:hypothetical protein LE181_15050 [Streptomyces sp. SCA3-4]|uniref:hypothetical protein n=1 Tax=Streptomyces sichuanensis TaxID=2871810 RepID=UPI001CE3487F|nr:hypothetical protein [Streptomyces sichuanensis]MCA6093472.1 hypothetical protein [Streptomyces sichuanensis]
MSRRTRAADRELGRIRRRESLAVLLARADRLLPTEADLLRVLVETELAAADRTRRTAGGQTAAVSRLRARVEAADAAIVETEADRDRAQQALRRLREQHRGVEAAYVEHLATAAVLADALGHGLAGDDRHLAETIRRVCTGEITPRQALAATAH